MPAEFRPVTFTIPPGSTKANPHILKVSFPFRVVTNIHWRVPPGPGGQMGFAVGSGGVQIIPLTKTTWIVTTDEARTWPLTTFWTSGAWELFGYNTGTFTHTIYFLFYCTLPSKAIGPAVLPLTSSGLSTSGKPGPGPGMGGLSTNRTPATGAVLLTPPNPVTAVTPPARPIPTPTGTSPALSVPLPLPPVIR